MEVLLYFLEDLLLMVGKRHGSQIIDTPRLSEGRRLVLRLAEAPRLVLRLAACSGRDSL